MAERRWKDYDWHIATPDGKQYISTNQAQLLAVLMDIRDELKVVSRKLSALECVNFIDVPRKLDQIAKNTRKKRKPRVVGKPKLRVVTR